MLLIHLIATWFMVGLIWFVQVVHYPMFSLVTGDSFVRYEAAHQRLTTFVVLPVMLIELLTAAMLLWSRPRGVPVAMLMAGLGLLVGIWLVTFMLSVPAHQLLAVGFDAQAHRRLVDTNWLRTVGWTLRGGLVAWMLVCTARAVSQLPNSTE